MRLTTSGATGWRHLSGFWLVVISLVYACKAHFWFQLFSFTLFFFIAIFIIQILLFLSIFLFYVTCQCALIKLSSLCCTAQLI